VTSGPVLAAVLRVAESILGDQDAARDARTAAGPPRRIIRDRRRIAVRPGWAER
jgi:hypothetical protein